MSEPLVRITGLDKESSSPSGEGSLVNIYLTITPPPPGWISIFDEIWPRHHYMKKRHARATSNHIIIRCMPDEVTTHHIPELKKAIETTDEEYRKATAINDRNIQQSEEKEQKFRDDLDELENNLDL